ncbi:MAG: phosphoribosyl-ATP diphosphatase, partial [Phycisphaeraceae bacterium]|nr:phosphoribosyl-ATP diphosphatase [Phycisphaeraceae bacterium]
GRMTFWSRSRGVLWEKGETSGDTMNVVDMRLDCDADTVLARVNPTGPACHTGSKTCFEPIDAPVDDTTPPGAVLGHLWATITSRVTERPPGSYTTALLDGGVDACSRKVAEEATEVLIAAKDHGAGTGPSDRVVEESADLLYHLLVLLAERGIGLEDVEAELRQRAG